MSLIIWWIRRDLRLSDNPVLDTALNSSSNVLPVFIIDPKLVNSSSISQKRLGFLWEGLRQLDGDLRIKGSYLVIREGDPLAELSRLFSQTGAEKIISEEDFSPFAQRRDQKIITELPLELVGGTSLRNPMDILKKDGSPYIVYSPYMRAWKKLHWSSLGNLRPAPEKVPTPQGVDSRQIPKIPAYTSSHMYLPGEVGAHDLLYAFTNGDFPPIYNYKDQRDRVDLLGTSLLSPYLRFGMISARETFYAAFDASDRTENEVQQRSVEVWVNELIWRDFYISILYHFPHVLKSSFRLEWQSIPWINNQEDFQAWCDGSTGYPIVDASMRQLIYTGWMHNRARMISASFLVKDLLIDWRWGERWFMQNLIDGDPAANNGGWQWTAGTGTDAAPYFRIFNPVLQGKKFDPNGKFIRKWIPELEFVPEKYIQEPWKMPVDVQKRADCLIGDDYPNPIIDHSYARQRVLDVYRNAKLNSQIEP